MGRLCCPLCLATCLTVACAASPPNDFPDGEDFIVVVRRGADPYDESRALRDAHQVQVTQVFSHALNGFAFHGTRHAAQALTTNSRVAIVAPDAPVEMFAQTVSTGLSRIGGSTGRADGINVAIIDTGVQSTHPDVAVAGGVNCLQGSVIDDGLGWEDANGHGTFVAGIVGALDNDVGVVGVAPGARLWSARALDATGSGMLSTLICAIDWVAATRTDADPNNDIAVANMSLGTTGTDDGNCGLTNNDPLHLAICNAVAVGVVFVAAAGNNARDAKDTIPASYDEVLTVAALADSDGTPGGVGPFLGNDADDALASFSNFGADVDIVAPGVNILSTYKSGLYLSLSGTSAAAPFVTGAVALYVVEHGVATDPASVGLLQDTFLHESTALRGEPNGYIVADPDGIAEPALYVAARADHDVAVMDIRAVGDGLDVRVGNSGSSPESFSLTLAGQTANVVALGSGTSTTVHFTADPSQEWVAAIVLDDANATNNTRLFALPVASTSAAVSITSSGGVLKGSVAPRGNYTSAWYEWGLNGAPSSVKTTAHVSIGNGDAAVDTSATIFGTSATTYSYRVVAQNNSGLIKGDMLSFTTSPGAPTAFTYPAIVVTNTSMTLRGAVTANGDTTSAWFEWGLSATLDRATNAQTAAADSRSLLIADTVTGLTAGTIYYYRIAAANSVGISRGIIASSKTLQVPTPVTTLASNMTSGSATLAGTVNANGLFTMAWMEWGTSPTLVAYSSTPAHGVGYDVLPVDVTDVVNGLLPGATYYYRIAAQNSDGTARSSIVSFNTIGVPAQLPLVTTLDASASKTTATYSALVNPHGANTAVWFEWGTNPNLPSYATTSSQNVGAGMTAISTSQVVIGLSPQTKYYYRAVAMNSVGTVRGNVLSLKTTK